MPIQTGQPAPDFTLYDSEKKEVALSNFRGQNVLLLFFPLAFSSVCTAELCSVRDSFSQYNQFNVQVVGISVDSLYTLAKFKQDQKLNFTLLSDFNKEVSETYDSLYSNFSYNMKGVSKRAAFVIDGNGIIQYAEILENAGEQPNFSAIRNTIENMKS